jgi:hypothetical protein
MKPGGQKVARPVFGKIKNFKEIKKQKISKKNKKKRRCGMKVRGIFVKRVFLNQTEGFDLILIRKQNNEPNFLVMYFKKDLQIPRCIFGIKEFFCEFCRYYNPVSLTNCDIFHVWVEFFHPHEDDIVCRPARPADEKELELAGIKPR